VLRCSKHRPQFDVLFEEVADIWAAERHFWVLVNAESKRGDGSRECRRCGWRGRRYYGRRMSSLKLKGYINAESN
jgi:hypothetical protein